jgi:hypothetical protein
MNPAYRPRKSTLCTCKQRAEQIASDITFFVDTVMTRCYRRAGMKLTAHPLEQSMRSRLHHETSRMKTINKRLEKLSAAYNEFLDLRAEAERRKARVKRLLVLLGPWDFDSSTDDFTERAAQETAGTYINNGEELGRLRADMPLWHAMREYLSFVPEARIAEMEEFFTHIGFSEGNRQAIESALKRHPKVFRTHKRKRDKYISLKEQREESSIVD